jgi:hypothetical protein
MLHLGTEGSPTTLKKGSKAFIFFEFVKHLHAFGGFLA